jgi:rSAM/selenodomain-associated transferase 1
MVKSRLEKVLGRKHAAFLARAFLLDTISNSLRVKGTTVFIAHWPDDAGRDFEELIYLYSREERDKNICRKTCEINLVPQVGADLGERMANVSGDLFNKGAEKVLIIGSDSPQLEPSIYRAALELLNKQEVVLGPTFDGGYYLVGMRKPYPAIFNGIKWGTSTVYKETSDILTKNNIPWQELELSYDIDSPEDLEQLYFEIDTLRLAGEETICYHTEKCLKNLAG